MKNTNKPAKQTKPQRKIISCLHNMTKSFICCMLMTLSFSELKWPILLGPFVVRTTQGRTQHPWKGGTHKWKDNIKGNWVLSS